MKKKKRGGLMMKKESTTLIVAIVIILLIALVGFNFEGITGGAITHKYPIVSIYKSGFPEQNEITAGDQMTVEIEVGKYAVKPPVYIECSTGLETLRKNFGISTLRAGYGAGRDENIFTIDYKSHNIWKGECYAKIYFYKEDRKLDYLTSYFTVIPKEK